MTTAGLVAAAAALLLACLILLVPPRPRRGWRLLPAQALPPAAAVALVLLAAGGSLVRMAAGPVDDAVREGTVFTAVLRITGEPSTLPAGPYGGGTRYLVDADVIGGVLHGRAFASATPVVVLGSGSWGAVGTGDVARVLGTAKPADRVGRATAVFLPASTPTIEDARGWLASTSDLRSGFRDLASHDDRDGGLLPGMALGDRTGLEPALAADMKTTGMTHLTAVSGANCSYVVAFTFLGLRSARLPRLPAAIGAVVALVCFVLLVRPEPSVLRAAVMGGIGVAAVLSGRGRVSLTLLMLSIIILLAADPWLAVSFAFTLSVAATLGLVTVGPAMVEAFERVVPRLLAQLLAIPLTAQLFCTPVLVLIQPSLPVYSLPANILASPVVPAITLLGMAAVLTLVGAPILAPPLVAAAQMGTRWVAGVAETLADAPSASLPWVPGVPGAVIAILVSAALVLLIRRDAVVARWRRRGGRAGITRPGPEDPTSSRPGRERGRDRSRHRNRRRAVLLAAVLGCLLGLAAASVLAGRVGAPQARSWVLAMCDVGQGDAVVVRTTPGHALVVDAGPDPEAMDRCLDALRVEVIDALVITHLHEDHYGGIGGAVRGRTLTALYFSTGEDRLPAQVEDAATAGGVRAERLDSASTLDLAPLHVDVLWPREDDVLLEENNASAVLAVTARTPHGPLTILLMGDLEEDAAAVLLSGLPSLGTDGVEVLKVAHHGARNGGTALLEAVHPRLAVISVGEGNDYGHPHPSILGALDRTRTATARTDQLGTFLVDVVGSALEVRPLR